VPPSCPDQPVLHQQPWHPLELGKVGGQQRQPGTSGMGTDVQVIDADRLALSFQFGVDPAAVVGGFRGVGQYRQPAGEVSNDIEWPQLPPLTRQLTGLKWGPVPVTAFRQA